MYASDFVLLQSCTPSLVPVCPALPACLPGPLGRQAQKYVTLQGSARAPSGLSRCFVFNHGPPDRAEKPACLALGFPPHRLAIEAQDEEARLSLGLVLRAGNRWAAECR